MSLQPSSWLGSLLYRLWFESRDISPSAKRTPNSIKTYPQINILELGFAPGWKRPLRPWVKLVSSFRSRALTPSLCTPTLKTRKLGNPGQAGSLQEIYHPQLGERDSVPGTAVGSPTCPNMIRQLRPDCPSRTTLIPRASRRY